MKLMPLRGALHHLAIRALLCLYPRAWRSRYGVEFAALLAQHPLSPLEVVDVVRGSVDARWVVSRRVHVLSAIATRESAAPSAGLELWRNGRERDMTRKHPRFCCSFCGKSRDQVHRLVAGPYGVYICDVCVALCNEIITDEEHPMSCQQHEGARPAADRREAPWWQRLVRRWPESRRGESLRMTVRQLIAGAGSSSA